MTNEMKLLMALCDALGFEVEEKEHTINVMAEFSNAIDHSYSVTDYRLTKKPNNTED